MNSLFAQRLSAIKFSHPRVDPDRHLPPTPFFGLLQRAEDRGRRLFFIRSPLLEQMLEKGELAAGDARLVAEMLAKKSIC
jgi:hypothetical protein